jgi:signal transduction histidine kinase
MTHVCCPSTRRRLTRIAGWLALRIAPVWRLGCVLAWMLAGLSGLCAPLVRAEPVALTELTRALRLDADGSSRQVSLPDTIDDDRQPPPMLEATYRIEPDLGADPSQMSLYLSGVSGHARITVNGRIVNDTIRDPLPPRPRGANRLRLVDVPEPLLKSGANRIEITVKARGYLSLSRVTLGPAVALRELHDRKVFGLVHGPILVGAIIGCLGISVLLLFARRPADTLYGYFGFTALVWSLHTFWSIAPSPLLGGVHEGVWWTAMYSLVVSSLCVFALRFAGYVWPHIELALWMATGLAPMVFYAAQALGALNEVAELWRLGMVVVAFAGLSAVAASAWRRRSVDSTLLVLAGLAAAGLGLRDWIVSFQNSDNLPVMWAPYAALPFVVLVTWFLIDRFVRATESVETMNRDLELRVQHKSAELVAALEHMRAARDAAEAASRAKSSFLAAASHDLRQPMHALGLYMASLQHHPLNDAQRDLTDRMAGSVAALETLFNSLLDISRMDASAVVPQPHAFEPAELLHRLVQDFASEAERRGLRLGLRMGHCAQPLRALTDPLLLERVLRNLIGNALKFTTSGGVLVTARVRAGAVPVWRLEVWDSGPGIPPAEQERIFDEFYQVGNPERDRRAGLGLGLSIVRRLTQLLGLRLTMRSLPGHGSRFGVDVPTTSRPAEAAPAPILPGSVQGLAVGVIEDDPEVRDSMQRLLGGWKCQVCAGADADEVWREAARLHARLDAVIADLRLRDGRDGLSEIAALRRACGRELPALVVSGDAAPDRVALMQRSGVPWLAKPVPASQLRSWLASIPAPQKDLP